LGCCRGTSFNPKLTQNQNSDLSTHRIRSTRYGLPLSSCFSPSTPEEAEDDPVLDMIRYLDYRYVRFVFHPIRGKFQLMSNWRDPSWRNLKNVIEGLEGDTHDARAGLFGENVINIEEKPILKLLVDEVVPVFTF
jgi:cation-transporting P-type ATPase 13A2